MQRCGSGPKLGVLGVTVSLALSGCGGQGPIIESEEGGPDRFDITVTHFPSSYYGLPYLVAMEEGIFAEQDIEIGEIIPGDGGGSTVRNVLSGDLAFGDVGTSAAIQSFLSDAQLQIVGGSVRTYGSTYYVANPDQDFDGIEDLKGHRVGVTNPGSTTETAMQLVLESEGIGSDEIEIVHTGGTEEGMLMLEQGEVDSANLAEPLYTVEGDDWTSVFGFSDYLPEFQQSVIVGSPQVMEDHPDLAERFLRAHAEAVEWIAQNPEEAGRIFASYAEVDEEASVESVVRLAEEEFWSTGLDVEATNQAVHGMQLSGIFPEGSQIEWEELLNQDALPEELRVDPSALDNGS